MTSLAGLLTPPGSVGGGLGGSTPGASAALRSAGSCFASRDDLCFVVAPCVHAALGFSMEGMMGMLPDADAVATLEQAGALGWCWGKRGGPTSCVRVCHARLPRDASADADAAPSPAMPYGVELPKYRPSWVSPRPGLAHHPPTNSCSSACGRLSSKGTFISAPCPCPAWRCHVPSRPQLPRSKAGQASSAAPDALEPTSEEEAAEFLWAVLRVRGGVGGGGVGEQPGGRGAFRGRRSSWTAMVGRKGVGRRSSAGSAAAGESRALSLGRGARLYVWSLGICAVHAVPRP